MSKRTKKLKELEAYREKLRIKKAKQLPKIKRV